MSSLNKAYLFNGMFKEALKNVRPKLTQAELDKIPRQPPIDRSKGILAADDYNWKNKGATPKGPGLWSRIKNRGVTQEQKTLMSGLKAGQVERAQAPAQAPAQAQRTPLDPTEVASRKERYKRSVGKAKLGRFIKHPGTIAAGLGLGAIGAIGAYNLSKPSSKQEY